MATPDVADSPKMVATVNLPSRRHREEKNRPFKTTRNNCVGTTEAVPGGPPPPEKKNPQIFKKKVRQTG